MIDLFGFRHEGRWNANAFASLSLLAGAVSAIVWILNRPLGWDEIEFYRATDWVSRGRVPYRDFWEHHSPLQWFVYAPILRISSSTGGAWDLLFMRWAQLPLWVLTLTVWVRTCHTTERGRLMPGVTGLLLLSPAFLLFAVEYRVDALASALFLLGLVLALRSGFQTALGGCLLALVPMANLRLGPQALLALILLAIVDLERSRWGWSRRTVFLLTGALAPALVAVALLAGAGSLGLAWQQLVPDNQLVARLSNSGPGTFWDVLGTTLVEADPVPVLLLAAGLLAAFKTLLQWRRPDFHLLCAFLFLANLAFVYALNVHYFYHFQTCLLLSLPLVAALFPAAERGAPRSSRAAWAVLAVMFWNLGLNLRGLEDVRREDQLSYQDEIMRAVDTLTRPEEKVWDGCGFALRREPAYRRWFLPVHARLLAAAGRFAPLTVAELEAAAPAAFILNARTFHWLREWKDLGRFIRDNYLPVRPHLWVPAPNGLLRGEGDSLSWRIVRSGEYRLLAARRLATHPHFRTPFLYIAATRDNQPPALALDTEAVAYPLPRLEIRRNGQALAPDASGRMELRRTDRLEIRSGEPDALGVLLVPRSVRRFFDPAPSGAGLDAPLRRYF